MDQDQEFTLNHEEAKAHFDVVMDNFRFAMSDASALGHRTTFAIAINWIREAHFIADILEEDEAYQRVCDGYVTIIVKAAMACQKQAMHSGNIWQIHDHLSEQIQQCSQSLVTAFQKREKELPVVMAILVRGLAADFRTLVLGQKVKSVAYTPSTMYPVGAIYYDTDVMSFSGTTQAVVLDHFLGLLAELIKFTIPLGRTDRSCYRDREDVWQIALDGVSNAKYSLVWFFDSLQSPLRWFFPKMNTSSWDKSRVWLKWVGLFLASEDDLFDSSGQHLNRKIRVALRSIEAAIDQFNYSNTKVQLKALLSMMGSHSRNSNRV